MTRPTLFDLTREDLASCLISLRIPAFRADQIWQAAYRDLAVSYAEITTLPVALRERLAGILPFPELEAIGHRVSRDRRTVKRLFRLHDGETIETVRMEYENRCTVCISTQIGCAVGCPLCATGQAGHVRDLALGEIVAQVLAAAREFRDRGRRLSHVVYMGMGEPFLNYDATVGSIMRLNDHRGFDLGARSFTVSTSGIAPAIERFANEPIHANLAVSLHAATDLLRNQLVPINRRYPLAALIDACRHYVTATSRRITFEVALIRDINDSPEHARQMASLLRGLLCHVNLIPLSRLDGSPWQPAPRSRIDVWVDILSDARIPVSVRLSRGSDIQAGCGQLRAKARGSRGKATPGEDSGTG